MRLCKFNTFEAIITPEPSEFNQSIRTYEDLVDYGNDNGFDVVNYNEFFNSLSDVDKKTAPKPSFKIPFFALFHPVRKKPMFVVCDPNCVKFMPNFKKIVDDIISHEKIHGEQNKRRSGLTFNLPNPLNLKEYYSNKDEIMAFSWTIANDLKYYPTIEAALTNLNSVRGRPSMASMIWGEIKKSVDEKTLRKYKKYIYLYLQKIYNTKIEESVNNEREVVFVGKRNPSLKISVFKTPDGRITKIDNKSHIRFPFNVGQVLNRNVETWACNNNFTMDGKDTCPEEKIFGIRKSDVPQGHEWRHIFPHKFK
jgi:hypothetical protein